MVAVLTGSLIYLYGQNYAKALAFPLFSIIVHDPGPGSDLRRSDDPPSVSGQQNQRRVGWVA